MGEPFIKKILAAINGTEESLRAAMYCIMMARSAGAELEVLYVVDTATISYLRLNDMIANSETGLFVEDLTKEGSQYLDYVEALASSKGLKISKTLRRGNVTEQILERAQELSADMIVVGGTKLSPRLSYGRKSVSSAVQAELITSSPVPVLVVTKEGVEAEFKAF